MDLKSKNAEICEMCSELRPPMQVLEGGIYPLTELSPYSLITLSVARDLVPVDTKSLVRDVTKVLDRLDLLRLTMNNKIFSWESRGKVYFQSFFLKSDLSREIPSG